MHNEMIALDSKLEVVADGLQFLPTNPSVKAAASFHLYLKVFCSWSPIQSVSFIKKNVKATFKVPINN